MIEITFLGTSATMPTKERAHTSIHLKFRGNRMLFDCGENSQRQLMLASLSPYKIQNIFITHLHADHVLGLGGLLHSLNSMGREQALNIYGPQGIARIVEFYTKWPGSARMFYPINVIEIDPKREAEIVFENMDYMIKAFSAEHDCPCVAYLFEEKKDVNLDRKKLKKFGLDNTPACSILKDKGKVKWRGKTITLKDVVKPQKKGRMVAIALDTRPNKVIEKNIKEVDLFICEATHMHDLKEKSKDYMHMTTKEAAMLAKKAGVKRLVLTHFSPRYENVLDSQREAKTVFKNTIAAKDLMVIEV